MNRIAQELNTRPRKTLGFRTPAAILAEGVALTGGIRRHFFCEGLLLAQHRVLAPEAAHFLLDRLGRHRAARPPSA